MWNAFLLAFSLTLAIGDLLWRRIPRWFTVAGFAAGLGHHAVEGDLLSSLAAALVGLAAGLLLFHLGAVGGGDVKLVTAFGALLGMDRWTFAMEVAVVVAGAMCILAALHRRALVRTLRNTWLLLLHLLRHGLRPHPELHVANPSSIRVPFGVAAAAGMFAAVLAA